MFDPNFSLTNNLLYSVSNRYHTPFARINIALASSITACVDTTHHLISGVIKVATGIIATPHQLITGSDNLKNWTWKTANKHVSQALKHFMLIFVAPVTVLVSPDNAHRTLFKQKDAQSQSERIKHLTNQVHQQTLTIAQKQNDIFGLQNQSKVAVLNATKVDKAEIIKLKAKLEIAEGKIGLHETAMTEKNKIIEGLKAVQPREGRHFLPGVYQTELNNKDALIRKLKEDLKAAEDKANKFENDLMHDEGKAVVESLKIEVKRLEDSNLQLKSDIEKAGSEIGKSQGPEGKPIEPNAAEASVVKIPQEILNEINGIAEELFCSILRDLPTNACNLVPCGHKFDKSAIDKIKNKTCPTCMAGFKETVQDKTVNAIVGKILNINEILKEQKQELPALKI